MANYSYTVTAAYSSNTGTNVFLLDNTEQMALTFHLGDTVTFNLNSTSLLTHPFGIGFDHPSSSAKAYGQADGVTYSITRSSGTTTYNSYSTFRTAFLAKLGTETAQAQWTVQNSNRPTSGYFCGQHTGMGGQITITGTTADTQAPANPVILIDNGNVTTNSRTVSCALSATDNNGVTGYFISETNSTPDLESFTTVTSATSFSQAVNYTITGANGTITLYAWFRDAYGNISAAASDSITLATSTTTLAIKGIKGPRGDQGVAGTAASIAIGSVATGGAGTSAAVSNAGSPTAATLNFTIPKGDKGDPGVKGESGGFLIRHKYSSFTNFLSDSDPEANYSFSVGDLAFIGGPQTDSNGDPIPEYGRMYIYKGLNAGDSGQGNRWQYLVDMSVEGVQGPAGASASIQLAGTHNFTDDTSSVAVVNNGTQQDAIFQFTLPRGLRGGPGPEGPRGLGLKNGSDGVSVTENTVTFTYTDNSTTDVTIPSGPPGSAGTSISALNLDESGATNVLTITLTDNSTQDVSFVKPSSATVTFNAPTTLAAGSNATLTEASTSTAIARVYDIGIPRGDTGVGQQGAQGIGYTNASISNRVGYETTQYTLTLVRTDPTGNTTPTSNEVYFAKPADGTDGVSVTGVNNVDVDTINFQLSNGTTTSNIDLPLGLAGPSGTMSVNQVTTLSAGNNATVAFDSTSTFNSANVATFGKLNFGIPKGRGFVSAALANHPSDNTKYRITFTSDDSTSSTTHVDFDKPADGVDGGGASSLNGLSDVVITGTPSSGQIIQHNGVNFVNTTDPSLINAIALG